MLYICSWTCSQHLTTKERKRISSVLSLTPERNVAIPSSTNFQQGRHMSYSWSMIWLFGGEIKGIMNSTNTRSCMAKSIQQQTKKRMWKLMINHYFSWRITESQRQTILEAQKQQDSLKFSLKWSLGIKFMWSSHKRGTQLDKNENFS